jgi:flagellar motor switch protein FliN
MNKQDVLLTIAGATVDGVAAFLYEQAPGEVLGGEPNVVVGRDPLDGLAMPALTAFVSYEAGQGGFLFAIPLPAARRLIADGDAPAGDAPADGADELSEAEQAAFDDAMGRLIDAAAAAMGTVLGHKVEVEAPSIITARTRADIKSSFQGAVGATVADIRLFGEDCRLVQLIPTIFTMRATQALAANHALDYDEDSAEVIRAALRGVPLRVWAELGRAQLRTLDAAALADGAIVELDRAADDPIDVYVNGSRIATGRLIEVEENEWAVRLEHVFPTAHTPARAS